MSSRGSGMKEIYEDIVDIFVNNREHFEMTTADERELLNRKYKNWPGLCDEEEPDDYEEDD